MISVKKVENSTVFYLGDIPVCTAMGKPGYRDDFKRMRQGVYQWIRSGEPTDRMEMVLRTAYNADYFMVPGVNYNGNGFGTFCEYLGDRYQGIPWVYGWERVSAPAMTMSQGKLAGKNIACTLFGKANDNESCSIYREGESAVHKIIWPEEESPRSLHLYRYAVPFYAASNMQSQFTAYIVIEEDPADKCGYHDALDVAFEIGQQETKAGKRLTAKQVWEYGIAYAHTLYTQEPDGFKGFYIGMHWDGKEWVKNSVIPYELGWGGQNALLANSLLRESLRNPRDTVSRDRGFAVLDSWIKHCHLPIGITHVYYDTQRERHIEACDLGSAGVEFFEAAQLAEQLNEPERALDYRKAAMEICDFALRVQNADGSFAKCWNENGETAIAEGTVGAYLVMPLLRAFEESGEINTSKRRKKRFAGTQKSCMSRGSQQRVRWIFSLSIRNRPFRF